MRVLFGLIGFIIFAAGAVGVFDILNRHYQWVDAPRLMPETIEAKIKEFGPEPTVIEEQTPPDTDALMAEDAFKADSIEALQAYVREYPEGRFREAAAQRIEQIQTVQDIKAWNEVVRLDAPAAYETYLEKHPEGIKRTAASERLTQLRRPEAAMVRTPGSDDEPLPLPPGGALGMPSDGGGSLGSTRGVELITGDEPSLDEQVKDVDLAVNQPDAMTVGEREAIKLIIDAREGADPAAAVDASTSGEVVSGTIREAAIYGAQLTGGRCFDVSPSERLDQAFSLEAAMEWSWLIEAAVEGGDCQLTLTVSAVTDGVPQVLQRKEIVLPVEVKPVRTIEGLLGWAGPLDDFISVIAALTTMLGAAFTWIGFRRSSHA